MPEASTFATKVATVGSVTAGDATTGAAPAGAATGTTTGMLVAAGLVDGWVTRDVEVVVAAEDTTEVVVAFV